jgi:hypothetical protein
MAFRKITSVTPQLGDAVSSALSAVGITKQRVSRLLGRQCKCKERQRRLNELGQQAAAAVRKLTGQEPAADGKKLDDQTG